MNARGEMWRAATATISTI